MVEINIYDLAELYQEYYDRKPYVASDVEDDEVIPMAGRLLFGVKLICLLDKTVIHDIFK